VQNTKTGENIPNDHKIFQMAIKYFHLPLNRPNGHKIYQDFPLQDPPKFIQIGILGLKTNHLAAAEMPVRIWKTFECRTNFMSVIKVTLFGYKCDPISAFACHIIIGCVCTNLYDGTEVPISAFSINKTDSLEDL
jgi:hypothetical protein